MKKLNKAAALLLTAVLSFTMVTGCSSNKETKNSETSVENTDNTSYTIGIGQFAQHASLDNCREGFIEGLKEAGIEEGKNLTILSDNANADTGTAAQIADNYVSNKVDLICAIATPMAQSAYGAAKDTDIPVVYTAITDPVAAELANADKTSTGNITGTSDKLPIKQQLDMIRKMLPQAKTIGIMYTTSEINSVAAVEEYKKLAGEYGFEIVESAIATGADIPLAAQDLAGKVDCINNLTDNTVVSALPVILAEANSNNVPVFGSEIEQVKIGCLATVGLDYFTLGKQTGAMAAKILKGEAKASEMPFEVIEEGSFYANTAVAEALKIEIPKELSDKAVETFTTIEEN
ncbi:putative ABC transport system substrate-binding protein [Lachnotalea glycerini]|uniref:ABC transporter substrate-binding protein n=1 Tax=Lachnotalea glycerini TaxID=1763509 RepID=A0A255I845_9FIRM|nr:ABC transporter substrate-binding protein [Lachnotalea glycerini]PXV93661.1 putative ABC transport system substrate-binding protein [Lachnotalea glycerini]RDY32607.1 ABC transporter substrate-binding protein [Lachnotalea glycerini]